MTVSSELDLKPSAQHTWIFPELPSSLWQEALNIEKATAATVRLPDDYDPEREYPLLLFMGGAQGDNGHHVRGAQRITGPKGFICLSLPLFLEDLEPLDEDKSNKWNRLYIAPEQGAYIWQAWEPMLKRVFGAIPNIDRKHCFISGFSNGANAAAAVLLDDDTRPGLLTYFTHVVFIEGGHRIRPVSGLEELTFLLVQGDQKSSLERVAARLEEGGGIDVTLRTMADTGHSFPDTEKAWVHDWVEQQCGPRE